MDISELAQTVKWLEEERQRDKAEIQSLTEQLRAARGDTIEQAGRIKDLEGRLTAMSTQVVRSGNIEAAVEKAKRELSLMVQQSETRMQAAEREALAARHSERDTVMRAVESIRTESQRYAQYEKPIEAHKLELHRLGEQHAVLAHRVDEGLSQINTRLHGLSFLEDLIRRSERDIRQLQTLDAEIRQQQQLSADALHLTEIELQRQLTALQQELKSQRTSLEAVGPRIIALQEHQQSAKEVLNQVKQFEERLQRQQDQASEMQRLAEERQKRELGEWQAENEKRWRRLEVITEQRWTNRQREHDDVAKRLAAVEEQFGGVATDVDWLWQAQRAFAYHGVSEVQKWIADFEKLLEEREKGQNKGTSATPPRDSVPQRGTGNVPSGPQSPTRRG